MTNVEFERLAKWKESLKNEGFVNFALEAMRRKEDRTLIWGYTLDRDSFHVYVKDGKIHKVVYGYNQEPVEYPITSVYDVIPDKRVYPEASDYEFCKFIRNIDIPIPFTGFDENREAKQYYGKII